MNTIWEILYARQLPLHYAAPPICEVVFSGSSSPVIVLSTPAIGKVTGLVLGGVGGHTLSWNAFPGALCYNVYFIGGDNIAVPLAQCIPGPFELPPNGPGEVVVTPITLEGEGPPSDPVPYPTSGTFVLTITSDPNLGVPFSLGPLDVHGTGSGVTETQREYNTGQTVFATAELTNNFSAFSRWLLNGALYSQNLTTSVQMNANYTLTAVYSCENEDTTPVPEDFTLTGPTSLGTFQVPPTETPVLVSGDATAATYQVIYRGGSIQATGPGSCGPSEESPGSCFLPPGCVLKYDSGGGAVDASDSDEIEDHCVTDQETLESLFPVGESFPAVHSGGSLYFQWEPTVFLDGTEFPITDFECGNSCPQWEIIQDSGLITQPLSWHIRDYEEWILEALPIAKLDAGDPDCTQFTSAAYPLETDPQAIEWEGTSTESANNNRVYTFDFYADGMDSYISPAPDFFPIKMNGFQGLFNQVVGPRDQAFIENEILGFQTDPWPTTVPEDRYWYFSIWSPSGAPIWAGIKASGQTPIGPYQRIACACPASSPACLYLESGE